MRFEMRGCPFFVLSVLCASCDGGIPPNFSQTFGGTFAFPNAELVTGQANGLITAIAKDGEITLEVKMTDGALKLAGSKLTPVKVSFKGTITAVSKSCFHVYSLQDDVTIEMDGCARNGVVHVDMFSLVESLRTDLQTVQPVDPYFAAVPKSL